MSYTNVHVYQVDSDMRLAVQEALALMADAFKDLDESNMKIMEALLMEAIDKVGNIFGSKVLFQQLSTSVSLLIHLS